MRRFCLRHPHLQYFYKRVWFHLFQQTKNKDQLYLRIPSIPELQWNNLPGAKNIADQVANHTWQQDYQFLEHLLQYCES
jgi:hypothetical protein